METEAATVIQSVHQLEDITEHTVLKMTPVVLGHREVPEVPLEEHLKLVVLVHTLVKE